VRRYLQRSGLVALASGLVLALGLVPAGAHGGPPPDFSNDDFFYEHHTQHGPTEGHLPGSAENVELVGKLRLTSFDGDISDVSALQASNGR